MHSRAISCRGFHTVALLLSLALNAACGFAAAPNIYTEVDVPWTLRNLKARAAEQAEAAKKFAAFRGFSFSNQIDRSGITFKNSVVEDCGRKVKAIIYDHGTSVAAADVDGDGKVDIFFVNQIGGCELWRNLGNGKFENITESAGVGLKDKICVAASFADIDNDGDPDLFVTTVRMGNVLFENLGGGKFREISKEAGVDYVGHSSGAVFVDYDNDGLLDLFVTNVGRYTTDEKGPGGYYVGVNDIGPGFLMPERRERSILYKNMGNRKFKDVSDEVNLNHAMWSGDASFCDLNEDGFPDLYVPNMQGINAYYENQGGKSFVEKGRSIFGRTSNGAMGLKFFDYNQDGKIDLFITDMHSDMSPIQVKESRRNFKLDFEKSKSEAWCGVDWTPEEREKMTNTLVYGNAFYQNNGNGSFTEISDKIGVETFWPWGVSVGDLNADGYEDMFITAGMGTQFRYGLNSLLLNEGGKRFFDAEFLLHVEPRANNQVDQDYFTIDCNGEDKNDPRCYHKSGIVMVRAAISSRSSFMADLDDDGDLDLVVGELNERPQILISDLASKRQIHYSKIKLVGTRSNRDGLGATVRVKAGGKTYTQYHDGKSGYMAQSSLPLYFGLAEATQIEAIEITWPSGTKQKVTSNIGINRLLEIKEPAQ